MVNIVKVYLSLFFHKIDFFLYYSSIITRERVFQIIRTLSLINFLDRSSSTLAEDSYAIKMTNVVANWDAGQSETILEGINLLLEKGKLYAVIGMVGAGKSSFLSAILGEMNIIDGCVKCNGNVSYASQEAWVFGATVRQNILFGQPYERQRYQRIVKACALLRDFKQFPQGDLTIVGDRGSSLSGGQKARINLARALYKQADIYLLDDPLSAVNMNYISCTMRL